MWISESWMVLCTCLCLEKKLVVLNCFCQENGFPPKARNENVYIYIDKPLLILPHLILHQRCFLNIFYTYWERAQEKYVILIDAVNRRNIVFTQESCKLC